MYYGESRHGRAGRNSEGVVDPPFQGGAPLKGDWRRKVNVQKLNHRNIAEVYRERRHDEDTPIRCIK